MKPKFRYEVSGPRGSQIYSAQLMMIKMRTFNTEMIVSVYRFRLGGLVYRSGSLRLIAGAILLLIGPIFEV